MRLPAASLLLASLCLAGCTSNSAVDVLQMAPPSREITGSIVRPDVAIPQVAAGKVAGMSALAGPEQAASPALSQVALLMPAKPTPKSDKPSGPKVFAASFSDAHPIDFGAVAPDDHAVHGVDVSHWQGEIDWEKLRRQGANFAYIKATDGADHVDPRLVENWKEAHQAGLKRGAYHFFYWCSYASDQADWFIRNVPKVEGALPPVLDVEWNSDSSCDKRPPREKVLEKMRVFLERIERHYGQRPIIYTSPDFYEKNLKGAFPDHQFWLRSVAEHPSQVYPDRDWVFWQYSGSGLSHGVDGRIDLNVFNGDKQAWWRWVAKVTG